MASRRERSGRDKVLNRNLIPIITVYSIPVELFRKYRIVHESHSRYSWANRHCGSRNVEDLQHPVGPPGAPPMKNYEGVL